MRHWLLLCITILACACCATPGEPKARIFNARPLEPEGWWEQIYTEVRTCAALFGPVRGGGYDGIEWYVVPARSMPGFKAIWSAPNRIYLDERFVIEAATIRHELAHHLLNTDDNEHESPGFLICSGTF